MITNILAMITVMVVTNAPVVSDNGYEAYSQMDKQGWTISCLVMGCTEDHDQVPAKQATEKTETTVVVQLTRIAFAFGGQEWTGSMEKILSKKVVKWTKKEEWVEEEGE